MTKDGRPSALNDIRIFVENRNSYLKGQEEAVAYGRRLTWLLNGEGFSVGAFPALYVLFTSSLSRGMIEMAEEGAEWWYRYVRIGVEPDFLSASDVTETAMHGIANALVTIRPEEKDAINRADKIVREHKERLRFLIKRQETKKHTLEFSSNIAVWPARSQFFAAKIDKESGGYTEAEPIALPFYDAAFRVSRELKLKDLGEFTERPRPPAISDKILQR